MLGQHLSDAREYMYIYKHYLKAIGRLAQLVKPREHSEEGSVFEHGWILFYSHFFWQL